MEIKSNKDNLEKALGSLAENKQESNEPQISGEEEIGFHKGALNTLMAERNELIKMIGNIEAIMQAHLKRLQELGVNVQVQKPEGKK
jgi:hypothetical protein